jgi:hypothetical protein
MIRLKNRNHVRILHKLVLILKKKRMNKRIPFQLAFSVAKVKYPDKNLRSFKRLLDLIITARLLSKSHHHSSSSIKISSPQLVFS